MRQHKVSPLQLQVEGNATIGGPCLQIPENTGEDFGQFRIDFVRNDLNALWWRWSGG